MRAWPGSAPSRDRRRGGADGPAITLRLAYRPPYDWSALVAFLGARAIPGLEVVDAGGYRRTVENGRLEVRPERGNALALTLTPFRRERGEVLEIAGRVRRMFDLDADPLQIAATLAADPLLGPSVRARPGLRIPGAWDPFETCVRAILGQQVSVRAWRARPWKVEARAGIVASTQSGACPQTSQHRRIVAARSEQHEAVPDRILKPELLPHMKDRAQRI